MKTSTENTVNSIEIEILATSNKHNEANVNLSSESPLLSEYNLENGQEVTSPIVESDGNDNTPYFRGILSILTVAVVIVNIFLMLQKPSIHSPSIIPNYPNLLKRCPTDEFKLVNDSCYLFVWLPTSFPDACDACKRLGSHLVTIESNEENAYIASEIVKTLSSIGDHEWQGLMIGLNAKNSSGKVYVWDYGNSSYSNWGKQGFQTYQSSSFIQMWGRHDCVAMIMWPEFGKWVGARCDLDFYAHNLGFICEASASTSLPPSQAPTLIPIPQTNECPDDFIWHDNSCYLFIWSNKTFTSAEESCRIKNAHLVTVNNKEENLFLASKFPSLKTSFNTEKKCALMIGLNSLDQPGKSKYSWVGDNRSSALFTNFVNPYLVQRSGDCVFMVNILYENSGGIWETFDCDYTWNYTAVKGYVCEKSPGKF